MPNPAALRLRRGRATCCLSFVTGMLAGLQGRGLDRLRCSRGPGSTLQKPTPASRSSATHCSTTCAWAQRRRASTCCRSRCARELRISLPRVASMKVLYRWRGPAARDPLLRIVLFRPASSWYLTARAPSCCWTTAAARPWPDAPARVRLRNYWLRPLHGVRRARSVGRGRRSTRSPSCTHARPMRTTTRLFTLSIRARRAAAAARLQANLLALPLRRDETALVGFLEGAPGKITTLSGATRDGLPRARHPARDALPQNLSLEEVAEFRASSPRTCTPAGGARVDRNIMRPPVATSPYARPGADLASPSARIAAELATPTRPPLLPRLARRLERHVAGAVPALAGGQRRSSRGVCRSGQAPCPGLPCHRRTAAITQIRSDRGIAGVALAGVDAIQGRMRSKRCAVRSHSPPGSDHLRHELVERAQLDA